MADRPTIKDLESLLRSTLGPRFERLTIRPSIGGGWIAMWPRMVALDNVVAPDLVGLVESVLRRERES